MAYSSLFTTQASETAWTFVPGGWRSDATRRGVIFCHGATFDAQAAPAHGVATLCQQLGTVCTFPNLTGTPGGQAAWSNDSSLTAVGAHWAALKSTYQVKTDKVILAGSSMGGGTALSWALANPSSVAAILLEIPTISIDDIHDNNRSGLAAGIDTAYGGSSNWEAAKATKDAYLNIAGHKAHGIPMQLWYGTADTTCLPQFAEQFAAALGTQVDLRPRAGIGHDLFLADGPTRAAFLLPYV